MYCSHFPDTGLDSPPILAVWRCDHFLVPRIPSSCSCRGTSFAFMTPSIGRFSDTDPGSEVLPRISVHQAAAAIAPASDCLACMSHGKYWLWPSPGLWQWKQELTVTSNNFYPSFRGTCTDILTSFKHTYQYYYPQSITSIVYASILILLYSLFRGILRILTC